MRQYGGTEKVESVSVCAVYDPLTGDIHHWHHSLTVAGGQHPSQDQIAKDALHAVAGRREHAKGELKVLHVDPATEMGGQYHVDHERQTLLVRIQEPPDTKT